MLAAVVALALASSNPALTAPRTAVIVVTHASAEMPFEPTSFSAAVAHETARLGDHWITQTRQVKKSTSCSLDTFAALGFDLALCGGPPLPSGLDRLILFELDLESGSPWVRAAYVDPRRPASMRRHAARVLAGETRAQALRTAFSHLFADYGRVHFIAEAGSYLFIDSHWVGTVDEARDFVLAPGSHSIEVRRGARRSHVADLQIARNELRTVDVASAVMTIAAR